MAIRGDDPLKIKQRAGHTDFKTTEGYVREAEAIRDGFGDVFPPLPAVGRPLDTSEPGNSSDLVLARVARDLGSGRRGPQEDPDGHAACDARATGDAVARRTDARLRYGEAGYAVVVTEAR
jgi:hypothetical protein